MNFSSLRFYSPLYWPLWMLIGFFWLIIQLSPYRLLLVFGRWLGSVLFIFDTKLKHIASVNIRLCFPELSDEQKQALLKKHFISIGIALFETGLAWFGSSKRLKGLAHIQGWDNVIEAQKAGKGILFMGEHFLTLELVGRLFAIKCPLVIIYRPHKKPFINFLISKIRNRHFSYVLKQQDVRGIIKALKKGMSIWYASDIDGGAHDFRFIPFFGIPAATLTAPVRLVQLTGARVLPGAFYRRDDGMGYDLIVGPALKNFPSQNLETDLKILNQKIEAAVRIKPDQYIWGYTRFKTRPPGEKRFYKR